MGKDAAVKNTPAERLFNGLIRENPILVLGLGLCPALAVTTSAINGLGMGLAFTAVLTLSGLFISLLKKIIPDRIRIPVFLIIVAALVTIVDMLMKDRTPDLHSRLGIYIPLMVLNCLILGRSESYALKNGAILSAFDGLGMGLGLTLVMTVLGFLREFLGAGSVFGKPLENLPEDMPAIFVMAPGAFLMLAVLATARNFLVNKFEEKGRRRPKAVPGEEDGCAGCAMAESCGGGSGEPEAGSWEEEEDGFVLAGELWPGNRGTGGCLRGGRGRKGRQLYRGNRRTGGNHRGERGRRGRRLCRKN